jgi:hypothetical protein
MLRTSVIAAALLALTTATARAEETALVIDGHKFVELCNATDKETKLVCASFTLGVSDTLAVWLALRPNSARACIPSAVLLNQLVDVGLDLYPALPRRTASARSPVTNGGIRCVAVQKKMMWIVVLLFACLRANTRPFRRLRSPRLSPEFPGSDRANILEHALFGCVINQGRFSGPDHGFLGGFLSPASIRSPREGCGGVTVR